MKNIYLFVTGFYSILGLSQQYIKFRDSLTNEPIPYVHLYSNDQKKHIISDSLGAVTFYNIIDDTLNIRVLGYNDKKITEISTKTVFLAPKIATLKEVIVCQSKNKFLHQIKPDFYFDFVTKNSISLIRIENSKVIKIKNIGLFVKKKPKGNFIRPHIYEYKNGKLSKLLDTTILNYNYKKNIVLFNLEKLDLISDSDLYIGFEFLKQIEIGRITNENNLFIFSIAKDKLIELQKNTSSMSFFIEKY
jgi:hypothetical protein